MFARLVETTSQGGVLKLFLYELIIGNHGYYFQESEIGRLRFGDGKDQDRSVPGIGLLLGVQLSGHFGQGVSPIPGRISILEASHTWEVAEDQTIYGLLHAGSGCFPGKVKRIDLDNSLLTGPDGSIQKKHLAGLSAQGVILNQGSSYNSGVASCVPHNACFHSVYAPFDDRHALLETGEAFMRRMMAVVLYLHAGLFGVPRFRAAMSRGKTVYLCTCRDLLVP